MEFMKRFAVNLAKPKAEPLEAAKGMISAIQVWAGNRDVFGEKNLKWSPFLLLAVAPLAGSLIYTGLFSQVLFLAQVFPDKLQTLQALNNMSSTSMPLSSYIFMLTSRNRLRIIMGMSHDGLSVLPEDTSVRARMIQTLNRARGISWVVILYQVTAHFAFIFLPLVFTIFGSERHLPYTPGVSFGPSPKYETPSIVATYVIASLACLFSAFNQTGYFVLFVTLVAHELGHIYAITETFNDIFIIVSARDISKASRNSPASNLSKTVDDKLLFCIRHHQFLIKYHEKIRELYSTIFGAQFFLMVTVLVTVLQNMKSFNFGTTILSALIGMMPLTIYCFGGELIISAAEDMSQAIYSCGWEFMEARRARSVYLVLGLSQRPLHLTAAGFATMNRDTFANVVQTVYKIYAVFD